MQQNQSPSRSEEWISMLSHSDERAKVRVRRRQNHVHEVTGMGLLSDP